MPDRPLLFHLHWLELSIRREVLPVQLPMAPTGHSHRELTNLRVRPTLVRDQHRQHPTVLMPIVCCRELAIRFKL